MAFIIKALAGVSLTTILTVISVVFYVFNAPPPEVPTFENTWWGPRDPQTEDTSIRPFKINISDEILNDLKWRLDNVGPLQDSLEDAKQHYGINSKLVSHILDFWRTKYNWREQEKFLNQFPQYTVSVQGLRIHYIHVKPKNTQGLKVVPMLLLHGWPGSVREFYEMIPLLTTPVQGAKFVFEVVVPSLPGYGFSEAAVRPGLGAAQMAVLFKIFMEQLNFDKYYVQGGDWGALITQLMAALFPEKIIAMHSNGCIANGLKANLKLWFGAYFPKFIVEDHERTYTYPLSTTFSEFILEMGYMHLQATKPDTVGVALRESPIGLAAYILEKCTTWTNKSWRDFEDGGLTKKYTLSALLDNVMIYWVTRSYTTSARLYAETLNKSYFSMQLDE